MSAPAEVASDEPAAEPPPPSGPLPPIDLDEVILAWGSILPAFPPATKAAAQEAHPISVDDDVITFGIAKHLLEGARPRFQREADNIRTALSERFGRRVRFKLQAMDGFGSEPPARPGSMSDSRTGDAPPGPPPPGSQDEPPEEDMIDPNELVDAPPGAAAVDTVGLFTQRFDATVVEERPHD